MLPSVLLVEDDRSVRDAASLVLEGAGFAVSPVADGNAAVASATARPGPDLIVLDLTRAAGGSGLGLDIARQTVRRMGGDITAARQPRPGARFMVIFLIAAVTVAVIAGGSCRPAKRESDGRSN